MNRLSHYTRNHLLTLTPRHPTFVGIDSDGCIFPTMEIKQKQCFHPLIISSWRLEPVEKALREAAEFVNLNSVYRGQNRFLSLLRTFDLLRDHPDIRRSGFTPPPTASLRAFCESGVPLGNASLQARVEATQDPELQRILDWSLAVNAEVERTARNIAPFHGVIESLEAILSHSDAICVSQTPEEALIREWQEHDLVKYVRVIAGQELGTKADHLALATRDRYRPDQVLMIGDAPGDLKAAQAVNALFFPINPGHEAESWNLFLHEAYSRFLDGRYDRPYEAGLVQRFNALLPDTPSWMSPR